MQQPFSVLYEVIETNADLEEVCIVFQGFHRDIAETLMYKKFNAAGFEKDFVLYNRKSREIECTCFTTKTATIRNECRG